MAKKTEKTWFEDGHRSPVKGRLKVGELVRVRWFDSPTTTALVTSSSDGGIIKQRTRIFFRVGDSFYSQSVDKTQIIERVGLIDFDKILFDLNYYQDHCEDH